ncbi:MAG: helix-turn-helix domain-containing protein [Clostridiales bacterium]|nr:helix-turn-helix domain-containing protein [Clostridiales bacterium]
MLSNQKFRDELVEIRQACGMEMALCNSAGQMIAATDGFEQPPEFAGDITDFLASQDMRDECEGFQFIGIAVDGEADYVLVAPAGGEMEDVCAQMAACQIRSLAKSSAGQFDRNSFIQNILLGNMLVVDIMSKAKKHHISDIPRVVFAIDTGKKNNDVALELVKNLSDIRSGDFVTSVDPHSVILVKDVEMFDENRRDEMLVSLAASLVDNLHSEAMIKVRVGYGNVVTQLAEIAQSYQEAQMALEVGRVFYAEHDTISYGKLGIGRLIYQLPMSLCEMFIKEVFGEKVPEILEDEEAMNTINKFFENNLNISETARQLYVHRNTLVYRLERIEKAIGLDIRSFDDAMMFRIAVMVLAHMKNQR